MNIRPKHKHGYEPPKLPQWPSAGLDVDQEGEREPRESYGQHQRAHVKLRTTYRNTDGRDQDGADPGQASADQASGQPGVQGRQHGYGDHQQAIPTAESVEYCHGDLAKPVLGNPRLAMHCKRKRVGLGKMPAVQNLQANGGVPEGTEALPASAA